MSRSFESDANNYSIVRRMNDDNSDSSSDDSIPSFTRLGREPVPVISSCQGLLDAIEKFREDVPFIAELLRKSTVGFTDKHMTLVHDVLEGAEIESKYGFLRQYYNSLYALEESLEERISGEKKFFMEQKLRYAEIYEILRQSSFPYSTKQAACLHSMVRALYLITGNPDSDADKEFIAGMRGLIQLLNADDHLTDPTPHRFFITHTLHYYLRGILTKVDELAKEEAVRPHPDFIHPHSEIDMATWLSIHLDVLVDVSKVLTPREHFHYGMVEIYSRIVEIFRESGLDFSEIQEVVLQKIERRVRDLRKSPLMSKHHGIVEACSEFMKELEEDNPDREYKLEDDKLVLAPEGNNNKAIREISWGLVYLQPVATEHLANFSSFGNGVENLVARLMEHFLELYPLH